MLIVALALALSGPVPSPVAPPVAARDPFVSLADADVSCGGLASCPPLQRVDLDAIKVQGVVAGTASPRAMLVLPDGTAHIVKVGDVVGRHFGRVSSIRPGAVTVSEEFWTFLGGHITEKHVLQTG